MISFIWVSVPAGKFLMGSEEQVDIAPFADEAPQHRFELPVFSIARTPVTNAQYKVFVDATGHPRPGHWLQGRIPSGREDHPVTYVDWDDACAFCCWAGVRLPSEAEWEKVARSADGRLWPWGDRAPGPSRCNSANTFGDTTSVYAFPQGASPYGVLDLAGNACEWTSSLYRSYPYCPEDGRETRSSRAQRVVRGGTYNHAERYLRCASRQGFYPTARDVYTGFRVASSSPPASSIPFDWVPIPASGFFMGSHAPEHREHSLHAASPPASRHNQGRPCDFDNELPRHKPYLPAFRLAQTPVTNAQYRMFTDATGHPTPGHWAEGHIPSGLGNHPVTYVDWDQAQAFCAWAGARLPSEAEWEKAARGMQALEFPWGSQLPDQTLANFSQNPKETTTMPVGQHPQGASSFGALDMAGNVWEWVSSLYRPYPYQSDDGREDPHSRELRVLRGGSFYSDSPRYLRCAARSMSYPQRRRDHIGFRVVALS